MLINPYRFGFAHPDDNYANTALDQKQAWGIVGDSTAVGTSPGKGPTPTTGTVYEFHGGTINEIGSNDLSTANVGSPWPRFGIDYNSGYGMKPVFVSGASGGAEFYPNGDNNNWSTTGTLYAAWKTKMDAALLALGVVKPRGILVSLGINDVRGAQVLANIVADVSGLIDRINTDYNSPLIYFILPGRSEGTAPNGYNSNRHQFLRRLILNAINTYANVHVVGSLLPYANWGLYDTDNLHLTQAGNDKMGEQFARYVLDTTSTSKAARAIIANQHTALNETKKAAVRTFISTFSDFLQTFDALHIYVADNQNNALMDWAMMATPYQVNSPAFTANSHIETNGTNNYIRSLFTLDNTGRAAVTDYTEFAATKVVTTPASTSAYLFGKGNASTISRIYQGGNAIHGQCYDLTDTNSASEAKFADNAVYAAYRFGTTKKVRKNGTDLASATQASIAGITTLDTWIGGHNNNGALAAPINAQIRAYGLFRISGIADYSAFVTALETLLTAMAVP